MSKITSYIIAFLLSTSICAQVNVSVDTTICTGQQIFLENGWQSTTGLYYDTILCPGIACDTFITTNLTVASTPPIITTVIECSPYTHILPDGTAVNSSGTYTVPLTSSAGCQFDYTTILIINDPVRDTIYDTICSNEVYILPNGTPTITPGEHLSVSYTPDGCFHYTLVYLEVLVAHTITIDTNFCRGSLYILPNGFPAFNTGQYVTTLTNSFGCDSTITTNLTYVNPVNVNISDTICHNSVYTLPDNSTTTIGGTFTFPYTSFLGCDSTVIVDLVVLPLYNDTIEAGICNGTPYTLLDGTITTTPGIYTFPYTNSKGCDSIVYIDLQVSSTFYDTVAATICMGQSYTLPDNSTVSAQGSYNVSLIANNGCDSVVTTNLLVQNIDTTFIDTIVCAGTWYFLPNGFPAFGSGNYSHTLSAANGCDSVVETNLTFESAQSSSYTVEICDGETAILIDGTVVSSAGNYPVTLFTQNGCDSVVTLNLIVNPVYEDTLRSGLCGSGYLLPDGTITNTPGIYSYANNSIHGCDSNVTVVLALSSAYYDTIPQSVCEGSSFILPGGNSTSLAGSYSDTLIAVDGCDSIITTILSLMLIDTVVVDTVVCSGSWYILPNGFPAFFSGNYDHTLTNVNGCDSVVLTNLYYQSAQTTNLSTTICGNEVYIMADGSTINTSGTHSVTVNSIDGCDSTINVNLLVYPSYSDTIDVIICDNEWYQFPNGDSTNITGLYTDSLTTINGCDSILIINLNVLFSSSVTYNVTICEGDSFRLVSNNYVSQAGTYLDTLLAQNGCKAIITTNLAVFVSSNDTINEYICPGDNYTLLDGTIINSPGYYPSIISSIGNCDSVLTVNLNYSLDQGGSSVDTIVVQICSGENYTLPDGAIVSSSGDYISQFVTATTCDSLIVTQLTVLNAITLNIDTTICHTDSYTLPNGTITTIQGVYLDSVSTSGGCDSIIITTLNVRGGDTLVFNPTICENSDFELPDGSLVNTTDSYIYSLTDSFGCDSIVRYNLTVNPVTNDTIAIQICENEYYTLPNGWLVNTSDYYDFNYTSVDGCDSTVVINLSVNTSVTEIINVSICEGEYYTLPSGSNVLVNGIYTDTLITNNGCDSIIITNLIISSILADTTKVTLCNGGSYTRPLGAVETTDGIYYDTIINPLGCDSVIITDLNFYNEDTTVINSSICIGSNYTLPDGSFANTSGVYNFNLNSVLGCDSIVVINLMVDTVIRDTISAEICYNSTYTLPLGTVVSSPGTYHDTLINTGWCDSIIVTYLSFSNQDTTIINATICNGNSYILPDGTSTNTGGTYNYNLINAHGCDSILKVNLSSLSSINDTIFATVCQNEYYTLPNGWLVNSPNDYDFTYASSTGCDSTIVIHLTVLPISSEIVNVSICSGSSYLLPSGNTVNSAAIYFDSLTNSYGCDSILITNLIITPIDTTIINSSICENSNYELPDGSFVDASSVYVFDLINATGCDSVVSVNLNVFPIYFRSELITICNNETIILPDSRIVDSTGEYICHLFSSKGCDSTIIYNILVEDSISSYVYAEICKNEYYTMPNDWQVNLSGIYEVPLISQYGCDSVVVTELKVLDILADYTPISDIIMCEENLRSIEIDYNGYDYNWSTGEVGNTIYPTESGVYFVDFYSSENDCFSTDSINVTIDENCENCLLFVPNAFTPNNDVVNNTFSIKYDCMKGFESYELMIFDKWGTIIFKTEDPNDSWDGTYNNRELKTDVYIYMIKFKSKNTTEEEKIRGHVSLIR